MLQSTSLHSSFLLAFGSSFKNSSPLALSLLLSHQSHEPLHRLNGSNKRRQGSVIINLLIRHDKSSHRNGIVLRLALRDNDLEEMCRHRDRGRRSDDFI